MNVLNFDYDLEHGFAWIEVEGKLSDETYTIICCVDLVDNQPTVITKDCGHNWGMCGANNEQAFTYWGENRCMETLFHYAKENRIDVI